MDEDETLNDESRARGRRRIVPRAAGAFASGVVIALVVLTLVLGSLSYAIWKLLSDCPYPLCIS